MRLLKIMLRRNECQETPIEIPPHELPVLAYVHGEENCKIVGEIHVELAGAASWPGGREIPSAAEEHARLVNKYGRDKANESLEPRVTAVYGGGPRGLGQLEQAIDYGQREDVPWQSFRTNGGEPAHDAPEVTPLAKRTEHVPTSHAEVDQPPSPPAEQRAPAHRPAAMRPGVAQGKRNQTAKQKRIAARGGAPRAA